MGYFYSFLITENIWAFVCLFDLILYITSTIFQLNRTGSFSVEPVLSYDKSVLLKNHKAVTPVWLKPAASQSWVKHSTTEPPKKKVGYNLDVMRQCKCLVLNPITVYSYGFLFNCTMVGQASDSDVKL